MFKAIARVMFIAVLLVAFIGQSLAFSTAVPCETSNDFNYLSSNNKSANHNNTNIDINQASADVTNSKKIDTPENCCDIDCCDLSCLCITSVCSSCVFFTTEFNSLNVLVLTEKFYSKSPDQVKIITTLPYRPPIFIS